MNERLARGCQPTEHKSAVPESAPLSLRLTTAQETSSSAGTNLPGGRGWARTVFWLKETGPLLRLTHQFRRDLEQLTLFCCASIGPWFQLRAGVGASPADPRSQTLQTLATERNYNSGRRVSCLNCCGSHFMTVVGLQVHGTYSTHWTQRSSLSASERTGALLYSCCLRLTCAFSAAAADSS